MQLVHGQYNFVAWYIFHSSFTHSLSENSFGDEGAIFLSGAMNAMPNLQMLE